MQQGLVPVAFKRNSRAINACAAQIGYRTQWQAERAGFSANKVVATPPLSSCLLSNSPVGVGLSPSRPLASLADGHRSQKPEDLKNQQTRPQTKTTRLSRAACATDGVTK